MSRNIIKEYANSINDTELKNAIDEIMISKVINEVKTDLTNYDIYNILNGQNVIYDNVKKAKEDIYINKYNILKASDDTYKTNIQKINKNNALESVTDTTINNANNIIYDGDLASRKYDGSISSRPFKLYY